MKRGIDRLVFEWYGLTPAEIKLVESSFVPRGGTTADKESAR
jgi:hypothetical protein